jgi:hypothetical protein
MTASPTKLSRQTWLKDQPRQRSETIRFALLASRTENVVKQDGWPHSPRRIRKLRKPASAIGDN